MSTACHNFTNYEKAFTWFLGHLEHELWFFRDSVWVCSPGCIYVKNIPNTWRNKRRDSFIVDRCTIDWANCSAHCWISV